MKTFTTRFKNQRGAAAVEFALIASILFMLLFGIFEFGAFYSRYNVYQGAAREGARLAAIRPVTCSDSGSTAGCVTPTEVADRVVEAAEPYEICSGANDGEIMGGETNCGASIVTVSVADGGGSQCTADTIGDPVTVSWSQRFDISLPLIPAMHMNKTVEGTFRCE
jgi:hypothetical protein